MKDFEYYLEMAQTQSQTITSEMHDEAGDKNAMVLEKLHALVPVLKKRKIKIDFDLPKDANEYLNLSDEEAEELLEKVEKKLKENK